MTGDVSYIVATAPQNLSCFFSVTNTFLGLLALLIKIEKVFYVEDSHQRKQWKSREIYSMVVNQHLACDFTHSQWT